MSNIIAVDLDGTLLSSANQITEYTKKVISLLTKKNFLILASGRHYIDIKKIKDILNVDAFIIASNGAKIYDLKENLIFNDYIDEKISLDLCKIVYKEKDIITQLYRKNHWYINNSNIDNNFCDSLTSLQYKYIDLKDFKFNKISKIFFTSKNFQKLCLLEKKILSLWNDRINVDFSVPGCLEIVSGKTSKGYGLQLISNLLNISLKKCFSFGDGMNDKDMLSISQYSYIMKNADFRLKSALPNAQVIESNNEDGVAKCLYKIFIKKNIF